MNQIYNPESAPKKRMGAGVLFFNSKGALLIVKPTYKDTWGLPGGVIDENESPREACIREIKEELGLTVKKLSLVCVDYQAKKEYSESMQWVFSGGVLTKSQIKNIKLPPEELTEFVFLPPQKGIQKLNRKLRIRLAKCLGVLKNKKVLYLENGKEIK